MAVTFTAHVVPAGSGKVGVSVNVEAGDAVCVNARAAPAGHSRLNADADAVTLSLKLMTMVVLTETLVAPAPGVVLLTLGAVSPPPHGASGEALFRGPGAPTAKSVLLLSVSVQRHRATLRRIGRAGAGSLKQFVPVQKPHEITMPVVGQEPVSVVELTTRLPAPRHRSWLAPPASEERLGAPRPRPPELCAVGEA